MSIIGQTGKYNKPKGILWGVQVDFFSLPFKFMIRVTSNFLPLQGENLKCHFLPLKRGSQGMEICLFSLLLRITCPRKGHLPTRSCQTSTHHPWNGQLCLHNHPWKVIMGNLCLKKKGSDFPHSLFFLHFRSNLSNNMVRITEKDLATLSSSDV